MLAFAPLDAAVSVAHTIVSALTVGVSPVAASASTAVAIVLFTFAVRLLMSPLSRAQIRGERHRMALAPRVAELQRRHAGDRARLAAEVNALYRAAGTSPLAGCLPALLPLPFFLVMYRLFSTDEIAGGPNTLLAQRLLGVSLGDRMTEVAVAGLPVFAALLVLLALLAWVTSRRIRRTAVPSDGPAAAVLGRLLPLLPYGVLAVAVVVPLAAVLYLVTTTAFTAVEQAVLRRPARSG